MSQNDDNPIADVDFSLWNIGSPGQVQPNSPPNSESSTAVESPASQGQIDLNNWSLTPGGNSQSQPAEASTQSHGTATASLPAAGDIASAEAELHELVAEPETADEWIIEGEAAFGDSDFVEAERCFQSALRLNPINAIALSNLGVVYHTGGQLNVAERFYLKATAFDPAHADSYFGLAQLWCDHGNQGLALRYAARGLQREPNHPELVELATALSQSIDAQLSELRPS